MRSGICPKCGSTAVHTAFGGIYRGNVRRIVIRGFGTRSAKSDDYVCVNCGYFEQYFMLGGALRKIAKNWPLVSELDVDNISEIDDVIDER